MKSCRYPAIIAAAIGLGSGAALAQPWPSKPIRAFIPFAAGSATDIVPRALFEPLGAELGQSIIVENRGGAGGTLGMGGAPAPRHLFVPQTSQSSCCLAGSCQQSRARGVIRLFIGKGRHDLVREATQALARAAAAHDHVFDAGSTQGFELAHDLVWRADQAVRLRFLGRMTIGQNM